MRVISRSDHPISRNDLSQSAVKVLYRLSNAGFRACLVGGAVRDLLLGIHPKDFDIVTDAKPEEIKALFRNCRLIGRRFRLAHILFGREIVEVATFRGHHDESTPDGLKEEGRIVRDNVYGTIEEDALRRDFTINALFYDIANFEILDYCGAMADIESRQLRLIGEPEVRYQEDPVRMLRAVRLAVKLDLEIEQNTLEPIARMASLLLNIPGGRLWDESHKLFLAGYGKDTFTALEQNGVIKTLMPMTQNALATSDLCVPFLKAALENTDLRVQEDKPINPAFLYACFLWWPVLNHKQQLMDEGISPAEAMQRSVAHVITQQIKIISIPRRFTQFIRDVWLMQHRLETRRGKQIGDLILHPKFRAAYDFLMLRTKVEEIPPDAGTWWTDFQAASSKDKESMLKTIRPKSRRRRPRKRKPRNG